VPYGRFTVSNGFVLRDDDVAERRSEPVDDRNDLVAVGYGQRAAREEAVLNVDDGEHIVVAGFDPRLRVDPARRGGEHGGGDGGPEEIATTQAGHGHLLTFDSRCPYGSPAVTARASAARRHRGRRAHSPLNENAYDDIELLR
jgi:hypothetical protein